MGAVAVTGLLGTLLPVWSLSMAPADLRPGRRFIGGDVFGQTVDVSVGFYTWITSNLPVVAVIPMALAMAAAVAVTQVVSSPSRTLWGATAAVAVCALALAISVAIRPSRASAVTGPLARELRSNDLQSALGQGPDMGIGFGSGLIVALLCLITVLVIAVWQYVIASRPGSAPQVNPAPAPGP
jgi:hypothetical protein